MPTVKQVAAVVGLTLLTTAGAGVIAFLNEIHVEISFDKLKDFEPSHLESYAKLVKALHMQFELASQQEYVAFWVDDDSGKQIVRKSAIAYKNFRLNNRLAGTLVSDDDKAVFVITGYYNDDRIVFSHRGPISGTGIYILDLVPLDGVTAPTYAGYGIFEDTIVPGSNKYHLLQCPFVMINDDVAAKRFPSEDAARKAFPILNNACAEFKMFSNVTTAHAQ